MEPDHRAGGPNVRRRDGKVEVLSDRRRSKDAIAPVSAATSLDDLPLMLTVEETAPHLRVSRSTAYKLVHEYTASGGSAGLPHVRFLGRILIRRVDLAAILGLPPTG